jgi:hypothetical protein
VKDKPTLKLKAGTEIFIYGSNPWRIKSFDLPSGRVTVERLDEKLTIELTRFRLLNGAKLYPRSVYELSFGEADQRYVIFLKYVSPLDERAVKIIGSNQPRSVKNIPLQKFQISIPTFSDFAFDEPPPTVRFHVGDSVTVRQDWGDYYENGETCGSVECSGQTGILLEIHWLRLYNKATFTVNFSGRTKTYSIHRFIDKFGNYMAYGWHYQVTVSDKQFVAKPVQFNIDKKLSFSP